jgi:hypothetical protein
MTVSEEWKIAASIPQDLYTSNNKIQMMDLHPVRETCALVIPVIPEIPHPCQYHLRMKLRTLDSLEILLVSDDVW